MYSTGVTAYVFTPDHERRGNKRRLYEKEITAF